MEGCGYPEPELEGEGPFASLGPYASQTHMDLDLERGPRLQRYHLDSPSLDSPSSHTVLDLQQGFMDATPGRRREKSPQTTPTSALLGQGKARAPHVIRLTAHAGIPPMGMLVTSGSGIAETDLEEAGAPEPPVPRRCSRRTRSGIPLSPEPQASFSRSQLERALSSPQGALHGALEREGSYGEGDPELDHDYEDSDDLDERAPAKRLRRRVVVETKDPHGKPYSAQEIRRMKRRITNRESARRMRLKRQEEWGEVKQLTRQLREMNRQQASRIAQLEQLNARLHSELSLTRDKCQQLSRQVSGAFKTPLGSPLPTSRGGPGYFAPTEEPAAHGYESGLGQGLPQLTARAGLGRQGGCERSTSLAAPGTYGAGGDPRGGRSHLSHATSLPLVSQLPHLPSYLGPYGRPEGAPAGLPGREAAPCHPLPLVKQEEECGGEGLLDAAALMPLGGEQEEPHGGAHVTPLASLKSMDVALGLDAEVDAALASLREEGGLKGDPDFSPALHLGAPAAFPGPHFQGS